MDSTKWRESILYGVKDEEARLLSYIYLGGDEKEIPKALIRRSISKGLINKADNTLVLRKEAMDLVSDYPLFGEYKKTKNYNYSFIPFVLGFISEGYVPSDKKRAENYFKSDYFTSLFSDIDKDEAIKGATAILHSLLSLGIIYSDSIHMRINRNNALNFEKLTEEAKLSYIIKPLAGVLERECIIKSIDLLFRLRKIKELNKSLTIIEKLSKFNLSPYIDKLKALGIIYEDEDGIEAYERQNKQTDDCVVSSDFTLTFSGFINSPIFLFLKPVKTDIVNQWLIDKNTIKNGFSLGYTPKEIIGILSSITKFPIPDTVISRLDGWYQAFNALRVQNALILISDEKNSRILDNLPLMQIHILSKPASNVYIMNPDTEDEWRKILTYSGYDMLGNTAGIPISSEAISYPFTDSSALPVLNRERTILFAGNIEKKYLKECTNNIQRIFIEHGIFLKTEEMPDISIIEGFYFQEKLRVINEAISSDQLLYMEWLDNRYDLVMPIAIIKKDESTLLDTDKGTISVDKIWKIALLPEYITTNQDYFLS